MSGIFNPSSYNFELSPKIWPGKIFDRPTKKGLCHSCGGCLLEKRERWLYVWWTEKVSQSYDPYSVEVKCESIILNFFHLVYEKPHWFLINLWDKSFTNNHPGRDLYQGSIAPIKSLNPFSLCCMDWSHIYCYKLSQGIVIWVSFPLSMP